MRVVDMLAAVGLSVVSSGAVRLAVSTEAESPVADFMERLGFTVAASTADAGNHEIRAVSRQRLELKSTAEIRCGALAVCNLLIPWQEPAGVGIPP